MGELGELGKLKELEKLEEVEEVSSFLILTFFQIFTSIYIRYSF